MQGAASSPWQSGGRSSFQSPGGSFWAWEVLGETGQTNLVPSCPVVGGGGHNHSPGPPPRASGNCPVLGGRQGRKEDGSGLRSFLGVLKSPVRVPALALLKTKSGRKVSKKETEKARQFLRRAGRLCGAPGLFPPILAQTLIGVQPPPILDMFLPSLRQKGSKTTPPRIGPIPQASPDSEWSPDRHPCPFQNGTHRCSTNLGLLGQPQDWRCCPDATPLLEPGTLPHLSFSFLAPQTSWGGGHSLLGNPDFGRQPAGAARGEGDSRSGPLRSGSARGAGAGRRRSWVLSRAPGGLEHAPNSAPGRDRALGGLCTGLRSARISAEVLGLRPSAVQRSGSPGSAPCAPAPAAQLLRMTSSHLPPPGPHLPAG